MIDHELELAALAENIDRLKTRVAAMAARALAKGVRELSADLSLAKARIESLRRDMEQLRRASSGGIAGTASRSLAIQKLAHSVKEAGPWISGLEALVNDVRRRGR